MNETKPLYLYKVEKLKLIGKGKLENCKYKYHENGKFFKAIKNKRIGKNSVRIYRNDGVFNTLSNKKKIFSRKNSFMICHDSLSDMKSKGTRQAVYRPYVPSYLALKIPLFFDGINRMIKNNISIICNVKELDEYKGDINDGKIMFKVYKNKM